MSQTILFVCATGIATSTAVTEKVMEYCKEHGLNVNYFPNQRCLFIRKY